MPNTHPVNPQSPVPEKKKRGFASMDREQVREFARRGGVAAHRAGTAHEFNSREAREAGRKGGLASHGTEKKAPRREGDGAPETEPSTTKTN
jgi:general stress protein YciG